MSARSVSVGDAIPPYTIDLTLQRLVMEAAANRDFAPIHIDVEAARDSGAPGPYMNTTFIETLFEAALRTWGGLDARITMVEFVMKAFNCVGDRVAAAATVTGTRAEGADLVVDLEIWTETQNGRTATGSATVVLPGAA